MCSFVGGCGWKCGCGAVIKAQRNGSVKTESYYTGDHSGRFTASGQWSAQVLQKGSATAISTLLTSAARVHVRDSQSSLNNRASMLQVYLGGVLGSRLVNI